MGMARAGVNSVQGGIMNVSIMYLAIGFLVAALSMLVPATLVHGRAVRRATRRVEVELEQLRTESARQLAELGRRDDAINRLQIELGAVRDELRASEEQCAAKTIAMQEAKRTLSDK